MDYESDKKFIFKIGLNVFKDALMMHLGGNQDCVLNCESFEMLKSYLPVQEEPNTKYEYINLIDLINLTDFIDISKVLTIFQQDQVHHYYDKLKHEKTIVSELYNTNYFDK